MKKFLTLALVLGIAGLASATLQIRIDNADLKPSQMTNVTIFNDAPMDGGFAGGIGIVIGGPGEWTGQFSAPRGIPTGSNNFVTYYGDVTEALGQPWDFWYMDLSQPSATQFPAGDWFTAQFHCKGLGDVTIVLTDFDANVIGTATIHQTPEPITMVLLGLGGLFIRKR